MLNRTIVLLLAIGGFVMLMGGECFGDVAVDLKQADAYLDSGYYSQAEGLCNSIMQSNPNSDYALKAQGKLSAVYIMTGRISDANTLVDAMINTYKNNAELPAILYGMALRYKQAREFQKAESLSARICQEFSSSEQAQRIQLDTGKEQALKLIADGKYAQAEDAVNNMVSTAGGNPAMPATLFKIAREFKEAERNDETVRIYQRIVQNYPSSDFAGKARMGVDKLKIWNQIKAGDVAGAQTALDKLITDYNGSDDLPHTIHGVALKFEEAGFYEQAKTWYDRVKQSWSDSPMAEKATVDFKRCDVLAMVGTSSHSSVMQKVNELMSEFSGHWHLPASVHRVGQEYYNQAMKQDDLAVSQGTSAIEKAREYYRNSAEILEIVINRLPTSAVMPQAYNYAGNCYRKLDEYAKATQYYEKVVNDYPKYRNNSSILYTLAITYETMKTNGLISSADADVKIRAVYQKIIDVYPDSKTAEAARIWLNNHPL